jgi:hypothetical protein
MFVTVNISNYLMQIYLWSTSIYGFTLASLQCSVEGYLCWRNVVLQLQNCNLPSLDLKQLQPFQTDLLHPQSSLTVVYDSKQYTQKWVLAIIVFPPHSHSICLGPFTCILLACSCETLSLPYFPNNRLKDGNEGVSLKRWPPFTPSKIPGTHFC